VQGAVQSLLEQAGRIDVLINNAGYSQFGAIEENSLADAQAQFDTNVFGVIRMVQAVLPTMRQQGSGRIVNLSSVLGHVSAPYIGLYATSKFALEGMTEALRDEVRPFGIEVSLIEPGYVKTSFVNQPPPNPISAYTLGRQIAQQVQKNGLKGGLEPDVVAQTILRAVTTSPRLRHPVGSNVKALILFKRLLPEAAFERVKRRIFQSGETAARQPEQRPDVSR
jgi:short-subunit dehydrogenase